MLSRSRQPACIIRALVRTRLLPHQNHQRTSIIRALFTRVTVFYSRPISYFSFLCASGTGPLADSHRPLHALVTKLNQTRLQNRKNVPSRLVFVEEVENHDELCRNNCCHIKLDSSFAEMFRVPVVYTWPVLIWSCRAFDRK